MTHVSAGAGHPLDALNAEEIRAAVDVLREAGRVDETTLFAAIKLAIPDKASVKAWTAGNPIPRKAEIVARTGGSAFIGVVDLANGAIESWDPVVGGQPRISPSEFVRVTKLVPSHPEMREHLALRGIDDFDKLV